MNKLYGIFSLIISLLGASPTQAQTAEIKQFSSKEDTLKIFADSLVNAALAQDRFRADSNFVRGLVRALKMKNSFNYPFDSSEQSHAYMRPIAVSGYLPGSLRKTSMYTYKKEPYKLTQRTAS